MTCRSASRTCSGEGDIRFMLPFSSYFHNFQLFVIISKHVGCDSDLDKSASLPAGNHGKGVVWAGPPHLALASVADRVLAASFERPASLCPGLLAMGTSTSSWPFAFSKPRPRSASLVAATSLALDQCGSQACARFRAKRIACRSRPFSDRSPRAFPNPLINPELEELGAKECESIALRRRASPHHSARRISFDPLL